MITRTEMIEQAQAAARAYMNKWMGGQDRGACGFAWVTITPEHDGRTRAGRDERRRFAELGAEPHWNKGQYLIWSPGQIGVQSVDIVEAGAAKAAELLRAEGITAYAGSRLD